MSCRRRKNRKSEDNNATGNKVVHDVVPYHWTDVRKKVLYQVCLIEVARGSSLDALFGVSGWTRIATAFNEAAEPADGDAVATMRQIREEMKSVKKKFTLMMHLRSQSGFSWDEQTQSLTAPDDVWVPYLKANPDAAAFRDGPFPFFAEVNAIYGSSECTASYAVCVEATIVPRMDETAGSNPLPEAVPVSASSEEGVQARSHAEHDGNPNHDQRKKCDPAHRAAPNRARHGKKQLDIKHVPTSHLSATQNSLNTKVHTYANDLKAQGRYGDFPPIEVVCMPDRSLCTLDHKRAVAADMAGVNPRVSYHEHSEPLPPEWRGRFGEAETYGEAAAFRLKKQTGTFPEQPPEKRLISDFGAEGSGMRVPQPGEGQAKVDEAPTFKQKASALKSVAALHINEVVGKTNKVCDKLNEAVKTHVGVDPKVSARVIVPKAGKFTTEKLGSVTAAKAAHAIGVRTPKLAVSASDGLLYTIDTIDRAPGAYASSGSSFSGSFETRTQKGVAASATMGEAGAYISCLEVRAQGPSAAASASCSYVSAQASAGVKLCEVSAQAGPVHISAGLNLTCAASVGPGGLKLQVFGFGFAIGPEWSINTPLISVAL